jgi:hypothetical protein
MSIRTIIQLLAAVLVFLLSLGCGVYLFVSALLDKLNAVQSDIAKTIILASIPASATVLVAVITLVAGKILEQHLKIRDDIRTRKVPIYEKHVGTFFKILFEQKLFGRDPDQKQMAAAFAAFSEHAIIWGSVGVIRAWIRFKSLDHASTPPQKQLDVLEDLFVSIRKDVGSETRRLQKGELFRLFVNDDLQTSPTTKEARRLP